MLDVYTESIDNLRPYHRNPRSHRESVEHVMDSITEYGFRVPIVVDKENVIVAGHGRFKATQRLRGELDSRIEDLRDAGRDTLADNLTVINSGNIFCIKDSDLGRHEVSEFRITDNRITELSEWNQDLLQQELESLAHEPAGFTQDELAEMIPDYELDIDDADTEETEPSIEYPESGDSGVELICPHCLTDFALSMEIVRMELDLLTDDADQQEEAADV